jgi:hypothetical protein
MTATPTRADFLRNAERTETATDSATQAKYGALAVEGAQSSFLAEQDEAAAEAARQLALLNAPMAEDAVLVVGDWRHLRGKGVTLWHPRAGYATGREMLVTKVTVRPGTDGEGVSLLEGLVRL